MLINSYRLAVIALTSLLCLGSTAQAADTISSNPKTDKPAMDNMDRGSSVSTEDRAAIDKLISDWPSRPKLGANMMIAKYGLPQESSPYNLIWHDQGPFKRIMVTREEIPHDFPKPHVDFMEHTVTYRVPAEKVDELLVFDGSVTVNRTAGELSARCDLEGHNILTLNESHDIITGKKDAKEARKDFGKNIIDDVLGKKPAYVESLQFDPLKTAGAEADIPTIPGSPMRQGGASDAKAGKNSLADGEVLGFIGAIDENQIVAAVTAEQKQVSPDILEYAKMLHAEHGKNLEATYKLGKKIDVTPLETPAVDELRKKGAEELAGLLPLNGDQFATGFVNAMVKGHTEVLDMIDNQLMESSSNEELKKHLTETRQHVAMHLESAKKLQAGMKH